MARNEAFEKSLNLLQKHLSKKITDSIKVETENLALDIAKATVLIARRLLDEGCRPYKDARSSELVDMVKNTISYKKIKDGKYSITVADDSEGLSTFLEFGTGYLGNKNFSSLISYAESLGWRYDVNKEKHYKNGFFFKDTGTNYIHNTDIEKPRKKSTSVYSKGIRGTFYMYRARREMQRIIKRSKTTSILKENIQKILDSKDINTLGD